MGGLAPKGRGSFTGGGGGMSWSRRRPDQELPAAAPLPTPPPVGFSSPAASERQRGGHMVSFRTPPRAGRALLALALLAAARCTAAEPAPAPAPAPGGPDTDCTLPPLAADGAVPADEPLFAFGLLADVQARGDRGCQQPRQVATGGCEASLLTPAPCPPQYADKPDGTDELPRVQRYRLAPAKLAAALEAFRNATPPLEFVAHLGDLIDGEWRGIARSQRWCQQGAAAADGAAVAGLAAATTAPPAAAHRLQATRAGRP